MTELIIGLRMYLGINESTGPSSLISSKYLYKKYLTCMAAVMMVLMKELSRILDYRIKFWTIFYFFMENIGDYTDKLRRPYLKSSRCGILDGRKDE